MLFREFKIFLTTLMFFTRIPCSQWVKNPQEYLRDTSRYFPLIGWVVGGVATIVFWGGQRLWPIPIAVILSTIATILLTGALHEDGFIDVCDGFGGGWGKERILDIMKDSRIGAFGVLGIGLLLALKCATLFSLPARIIPFALLIGHSLSRFASISLLYTLDYVRQDASSKAKPVVRKMTLGELLFAAVWGIAPLIAFAVWSVARLQSHGTVFVLICLGVVWMTRWGMGRYFFYKIGGYTGDCLGAVQQVTEVVCYLVVTASFM